eukprot:8908980-Pyramimonas_sp.AAC.1
MIVKRPGSVAARCLISKSICRAVWRQDARLAERLRASHHLARHYLSVELLERRAQLLHGFEFLQAYAEIHRQIAEQDQNEVRQAIRSNPDSRRAMKLRRRMRGLIARSRLRSPFDRRLVLRGVRRAGG